MISKVFALAWLLVVSCAAVATTVQAHGVIVHHAKRPGVEIIARYDTSEPMAGAQVAVFAPSGPGTPGAGPWLTGFCDEKGRFAFVPDPSIPGTWSVRVRQAGHGAMIHITMDEDESDKSPLPEIAGAGYTTGQIALMTICVIWGSIGSALYFSRMRKG